MNRIIAWFAANDVASNLLMIVLLFAGLVSIPSVRREVFPDFTVDVVTVSVVYPGASPDEVEQSINVRIEEKVASLEGVKKVTSTAAEGAGAVVVEALASADVQVLLDDVKAQIDTIDTFPAEAEEPEVSQVTLRDHTITVAVIGDLDEVTLKHAAERVRDEISSLPGITLVEISAARPYEISIEVSEHSLRAFGLTLDEVARAVEDSSLDLPGGSVRSDAGEILLRTQGQAYGREDFEAITLRTRPDGSRLRVGDVATVVDGFAETEQAARFDGRPAVMVKVYRVGEQSSLEISKTVHEYVDGGENGLPAGIELVAWDDAAKVLRDRLDTLRRNGLQGLLLVFLLLATFLHFRLAVWVTMGIPLSFLGTLALMPWLGVSINVLSLFSFILVLGIVVDDAIVVGENIYKEAEEGRRGLDAVVVGAQGVSVPVIFGVLTTVVAFLPMLFIPGTTGKIMRVFPMTVIPTLLFSLFESKLVLPSHLKHALPGGYGDPGDRSRGVFSRIQSGVAGLADSFVERVYRPSLERALEWRYVTLSVGIGVVLLTVGLVGSGRVGLRFFPDAEADRAIAVLTMPRGTPRATTLAALERIERSAVEASEELASELGVEARGGVYQHIMTAIGEQPFRGEQSSNGGRRGSAFSGGHLGEVNLQLASAEDRAFTGQEIIRRWRERVGPLPGVVELTYSSSLFSNAPALQMRLAHRDMDTLLAASARVQDALRGYPGVYEVGDSFRSGKQEIRVSITPEGEALGLSLVDVARQVRQSFYGREAQRVQRGREDLKVMVRYPEEDRRTLSALEQMRIRTPAGNAVPFSRVARMEQGRGFATIERSDRRRVVDVSADVDPNVTNANVVMADLRESVLPGILADYPGMGFSLEGEQREQRESLSALGRGFLVALLVIFCLMAIPLASYLQPLIVMSAIPFGIAGAIWAHFLLGLDLSFLSIFGIIALVGVVVNDSLVLVDHVNKIRDRGGTMAEAVRDAGVRRFRPILLTSLTTFAGLMPLLLERSLQAQFLVPMAVSLGCGVLFATGVSLVLVPCSYIVLEDFRALLQVIRTRGRSLQ